MPSIIGSVLKKDPDGWIQNGNIHTATSVGAEAQFVDHKTGQVQKHNFNAGGSFIQLDDIISFFSSDVLPTLEEVAPVVEELAPLALL